MGYRLEEVDHRVMRLIDQVKEFDAELGTELWDAVWEQLLRAIGQSHPAVQPDAAL